MQKLILLDPGHGAMVNGIYITPGKRSPKWKDLPQLFEGVQNRDITTILKTMLSAENIPYLDMVDSDGHDTSLQTRVDRANTAYNVTSKNSLYVSIHADAAGDGTKDHPATGVSVYTSPGQTKSDKLAEYVIMGLGKNLGNITKYRLEKTDGDSDKEEKFFVLVHTKMPSILCELGFMTNRKECALMQTQDWKTRCAQSILDGIKEYYKSESL